MKPYTPRCRMIWEVNGLRIPQKYTDCIAYLAVDGEADETGHIARIPRGSAFQVSVMSSDDRRFGTAYYVTARHCIEERRSGETIFIQIGASHSKTNQLIEIPTAKADWLVSEAADVAVLDLNWLSEKPSETAQIAHFPSVEVDEFIDEDYSTSKGPVPPGGFRMSVGCGDNVFIPGLFAQSPGSSVYPAVRYGAISRMPVEPMLLKRYRGAEPYEALVYLVECLSWPGQSGSPVFWTHPYHRTVPNPYEDGPGLWVTDHVTALLGVLSAHVSIKGAVNTSETIASDTEWVKLNSGMAIVSPAVRVRELLLRDDIAAERENRLRRAAREHDRANALG